MVYGDEYKKLWEDVSISHFSGFSLLFCFVALTLRIQFASLRDRSLNHAKILTSFPEPGRIILDMERYWINPSYADFTALAQ
jgi:hypothetical protein